MLSIVTVLEKSSKRNYTALRQSTKKCRCVQKAYTYDISYIMLEHEVKCFNKSVLIIFVSENHALEFLFFQIDLKFLKLTTALRVIFDLYNGLYRIYIGYYK